MVTKANFKEFLTNEKFHILTKEEFDTIVDYCEFSLSMPTTGNHKVILSITINAPLPFKIYEKLINVKIPDLKIDLINGTPSNDYSFLNEYIQYFLATYHPEQTSLKELLSKENVSGAEKILYIKHVFENEKKEILEIEKELLLFLSKVDFDFEKTSYVVNNAKLQLIIEAENAKKQALKQAADAIANQKEDPLAKYKNKFIVKGPFASLSEVAKAEIDEESKERIIVKVSGEIFETEHKPNKWKKDNEKYTFSIYDYEMGAIRLSYSCPLTPTKQWKGKLPDMPKVYMDSFKVGDWINAQIILRKDKKSNSEVVGTVQLMCHTDKPAKLTCTDNAKEKRIELLAHSNYTCHDALDPVDVIYKHARNLGHQALAIVDRDNVQAFPDIANYTSDINIKHMYGCEMELIDDVIPVCVNPHGQYLNQAKYVIFDIETTGLYPEYEDLIEFGAIKWENGQITDHIDMFAKPTKPLTSVAINMSHITEQMVENAVSQKEALLKIKEYIGDSVLIAHNGIKFDLNFLNKLCERYNVEPITNTLIDTLEISHSINPQFSRHNLGTLTRKLKIEYNELIAHRADKDSEYLLYVWQYFLKRLAQMSINNVNQINAALQNNTLKANRHGYYVDIYAKNDAGAKAIYKLITKSSTEQIYIRSDESSNQIGNPKIHWSNLVDIRKDLIICPNPMDGVIWESALSDTQKDFEEKMKMFDYIFVAPPKNFGHLAYREEITKSNINKAIIRIIETAKKLNIKVCAVSDSRYLMPYQKLYHEIYVYNKQLGGKAHWLYRHDKKIFIPDYHFMTTDEMLDAFKFLKDEKLIKDIVIYNTIDFANKIEQIVPIKFLIKGKYPYSPKIEGAEKFLTDLVWKNANRIWADKIPDEVKARIEKELTAIITNGYAVVYWISHLLVQKSTNDGYLVGSRGSVGSSLVAYLADISEVNPLPPHYLCKKCHHYETYEDIAVDGFDLPVKKCPVCGEEMFRDGHNIPFESFLGKSCDKIPDIDLNFSGEYQAKAHNFIKEMFGPTHAFRAGTISTIAKKTAFGFVKKYFEETDPNTVYSSTLTAGIASKCQGVKRTTGQHPGGIVVVPQTMDLEDFCPAQFPSNDKSSTWMTTHFDYHQMKEVLLKFDILGHDEPTILNHLQKETGIDPRSIPYFDDKVIELFKSSNSLGIVDEMYDKAQIATYALPEFGTPGTRKIVLETQPQGVGDLIKISGLSHGTGVWQGNAQELIESGLKINQVICCREDIIDFLSKCGLEFMTAFMSTESVRKGKGLPELYENKMIEANVPKWYIDSLKKIEYLFPKAHATAYVIDAIRTAWYKIYYPVQFYAVWMSIRTDKAFDIATIIAGKTAIEAKLKDIRSREAAHDPLLKEKDLELIPIFEVSLEMYARGIKMSSIDINKSKAIDFIPEGNTLIPPFVSIDGLGVEAAKSIVAARNERPFTSISDLEKRTKLNGTTLNKLKELHVLDSLPEDEQLTLF